MSHSTLGSAIREELHRAAPGVRILDSALWREIYARDASYFDIRPLCIVRASTAEELRSVLDVARRNGAGVTFRTGGTSLCGQALGEGIICELRCDWRRAQVRDGGRKIWFEPGLTANQVNAMLRPHGHKIGPDPASSQAAMMGGILANNSSGMEAGVDWNSYHTLESLHFMLANGRAYDSSDPASVHRFESDERELCRGLLDIRREILDDPETLARVRRKYQIKNVTGYAMNSFVDFSDPMQIFIHALIGSEGTLAMILSGELRTRPLMDYYTSSMLYFSDPASAAAQAEWLGSEGALAVEMMDYASLRSSMGLRSDMPRGTTAMLVDYGAASREALADITARLADGYAALPGLLHFDPFTTTVSERERLWRIRDGVFPCVAGVRKPGASVILEDVAAPVARLDSLVEGVQGLFRRHGYDGAIFGHARNGNIHPLVAAEMRSEKDKTNFRNFIEGLVDLVTGLDGSLKGEHGTGRAMAPFVEREWGAKIYSLMKRLKNLADPQGILNPGVVINSDPDCFVKGIKTLDPFGADFGYSHADKCIECGYCEHVCPSRYVTLTPRQRIQARRVIARTGDPALTKEYVYLGRDTCCTDGSCRLPCPMDIDTGTLTDGVRAATNPALLANALTFSARHYGGVEKSIRGLLATAVAAQKVISPYPLMWAAGFLHRISPMMPHWSKYFAMPPKARWNDDSAAEWLYFPACVTRIFGGSTLGKDDMIATVLRVARKAGLRVSVPHDIHKLCCSQIWEHKGDPDGQRIAAAGLIEGFWQMTRHGAIPIFCDTTSCTHTLLSLSRTEGILSDRDIKRLSQLRIIDITCWLAEEALPRLSVVRRKRSVLLHPTCAARLLGLQEAMERVAAACSERYTVPAETHCCGAAGDRGFIYPDLARAAVRDERKCVEGESFDGCYSLARTCEISLCDSMERPYESIVYLVDECCEARQA